MTSIARTVSNSLPRLTGWMHGHVHLPDVHLPDGHDHGVLHEHPRRYLFLEEAELAREMERL